MYKLASRSVRVLNSLRLTTQTLTTSSSCDALLCSVNKPLLFSRSYRILANTYFSNKVLTEKCACGCSSSSAMHTKGDKELVEFLNDEIKAEVKSQNAAKLPKIENFEVKQSESALELTRHYKNENIRVTVNVNHTVDAVIPDEEEINPTQDKIETNDMKSKPGFLVEITKGHQTLAFGCTIIQDVNPEQPNDPDAYNDLFNIDEMLIYDSSRNESTYAVSGEIMDGYLYDLLMNYLEERGISNEFVDKLIEYCTSYEHKLYVGLLEKLKSFVSH